jgi:hypothetical protein
MPLKTRRSSTRRAPGWLFGSIGSIKDQASSLSQKWALFIIDALDLSATSKTIEIPI